MGGLCPTISNSLRVFREEFYRQNLGQRLQGVGLSLVGGDAPGILCSAWSYHLPPELGDLVPAAAAKSLHSCPTLCNPIDGSPPGSPIPGILQATTLEWVAISFSNAWKWKGKVKLLSRAKLLATPWIVNFQRYIRICKQTDKPNPKSLLFYEKHHQPICNFTRLFFFSQRRSGPPLSIHQGFTCALDLTRAWTS